MSKRILIAPLDWGLGHATRCIPIIRHLLENAHKPILAASGRPKKLLQVEFPDVETVEFEGYNISYPEGSGMLWKMFRSTPHILKRIKQEHSELNALIDELKLDAVISDNRFGLYSDRVPCVYMTHQVMIKAPFFESVLYKLHNDYMQKFTEVWIPDHAENGLSGDLAHKYPVPSNGKFIGPLSRFVPAEKELKTDLLVIISGPEPQRTRFEKLVLKQLEDFEGSSTVVLGTPDVQKDELNGSIRIVSHLNASELETEIRSARLIVSRSGYSTIMDLAALGKQAVFVPTPGQTEQEYLAKKYDADGSHMRMRQAALNLKRAWESKDNYTGFEADSSETYKNGIDTWLTSLS
jgi:uncharacterized protein (TIGR00661 family)